VPQRRRGSDLVLPPGGFYFGSGQRRIVTLLGSCVAITFWHPARKVGGMCHYLLPGRPPGTSANRAELDGRYAAEAIQMFRLEVARAATQLADYDVKIFGGGHQFDFSRAGSGIDVPGRNIEAGLNLLADLGLVTSACHVGGVGARQVILDLGNGDVWLHHAGALG
jgi:chemotaxis protein CheD